MATTDRFSTPKKILKYLPVIVSVFACQKNQAGNTASVNIRLGVQNIPAMMGLTGSIVPVHLALSAQSPADPNYSFTTELNTNGENTIEIPTGNISLTAGYLAMQFASNSDYEKYCNTAQTGWTATAVSNQILYGKTTLTQSITATTGTLDITVPTLQNVQLQNIAVMALNDNKLPSVGTEFQYVDPVSQSVVKNPCTGQPFAVTTDASGKSVTALPVYSSDGSFLLHIEDGLEGSSVFGLIFPSFNQAVTSKGLFKVNVDGLLSKAVAATLADFGTDPFAQTVVSSAAGTTSATPAPTPTVAPTPLISVMATSPLSYLDDQYAVYTGDRLVVFGYEVPAPDYAPTVPKGAIYNIAKDTWQPMTLPPNGIPFAACAVAWGSKVVLFGGMPANFTVLNSNNPNLGYNMEWDSNIYIYDPSTDSWTTQNPTGAPSRRLEQSCAFDGTEMVVWGGVDYAGSGALVLSDGAKYNPTTNTWAAMAPSGTDARRGAYAIWNGSEIFFAEGSFGTESAKIWTNEVTAYNPATDAWRSNIPAAPGMVLFNGAYAAVGDKLVTDLPGQAAVYDPSTNTWTRLLSSVGDKCASFILGGSIVYCIFDGIKFPLVTE